MDSAEPLNDTTRADTPAQRPISITITLRSLILAAAIFVGVLLGVVLITQALGPLIALLLAIILGEAIRPMVARLRKYHIPGPLAVLLIYVVGLVIVGFLLWLLLNPLIQEANSLTNQLPRFLNELKRGADTLQRQLHVQGALSDFIRALASSLASLAQQELPKLLAVPLGLLTGLFGLLIDLVVVLTMTLFWLMASERLKPFVIGLFPADSQNQATDVLAEMGRGFGGYLRGTIISMALIGTLVAVGLSLLGVPYALLLGVLAGLTELLPYLGPWISGTVCVLVALITVDPAKALQVVILFIIVFEVEGNVVEPLVMSRAVNVDPLLVIVSVLLGLNLLGVIGAIIAVPIATVAQILVLRVLAPAIRRGHSARKPPTTAVATKT